MFFDFADDSHHSFSADYFAFLTNWFYRGSDFHNGCLMMPLRETVLCGTAVIYV